MAHDDGAQQAFGRNRALATCAILAKLDQALTGLAVNPRRPRAEAEIGLLSVSFQVNAGGIYFCISDRRRPVMTGYLDPRRRPGRYCGGRFEPMYWRRGWEWKLFATVDTQGVLSEVFDLVVANAPFGTDDGVQGLRRRLARP